MKKISILLIIFFLFYVPTKAQYPSDVMNALSKTSTNKAELLKALAYFYKTGDKLKIKSINFLIANMPIHSSYNYYWADNSGHRAEFNELSYSSFNDAVLAFNRLKATHPQLHPVVNMYRDIDSIKGSYLIENIEQAINAWKTRNGRLPTIEDGTMETFLEYELPYRVSIEPLENWRKVYAAKYKRIFNNSAIADSLQLRHIINSSFKNIWSLEEKTEPLPRLGALQIQLRGKGYCEDIADMAVFVARSQGIAASVDNVPLWATTAGNHFSNFIFFDKKHTKFDAVLDSLGREPGKVLRTTYSPQPDAVAAWMDTTKIPTGFLRIKNYKDVTRQYWPAANITCKLFVSQSADFTNIG